MLVHPYPRACRPQAQENPTARSAASAAIATSPSRAGARATGTSPTVFNISRLRDSTCGNFLYVIDVDDELVIARYPTDHIKTAAELRAYREELYKAHGLGEPGCTLQIRDSGDTAHVH
jgi:hypothetical protein